MKMMEIIAIIIKRIEGTGTQTHILKCGLRYLSPSDYQGTCEE